MEKVYTIKKATLKDVDFLADTIIGSEKGMTNKLGLATIFELTEEEVKELIISMLEQEIDGCEFSISSFFVAYHDEKPVAAYGGWLEGYYNEMPSSMIKASLIRVTFPKENIVKAESKLEIIKDILIEREMGTYQLEYAFVDSNHRGQRLYQKLMNALLEDAKKLNPNVKKAQLQLFENNQTSVKAQEGTGFKIVKRSVSTHKEILNYVPGNIKVLMEREL